MESHPVSQRCVDNGFRQIQFQQAISATLLRDLGLFPPVSERKAIDAAALN
jgi:hypothetical protein